MRLPAVPAAVHRLLGIDVLRAVAVLAMVWMHFSLTGWWAPGAPGQPDPALAWLNSLTHVRSRGIFFLLAGVTVAFATGGCRPMSWKGRVERFPRVLARAGVLLGLALVLGELGHWEVQILHFYAFWLVLLLPLTLLPAGWLFALSGVLALAAPAFKMVAARRELFEPDIDAVLRVSEHAGFALLAHPQDWAPVLQNVVFGLSPMSQDTVAVLPFLVLGLALGRIDLQERATQVRMLVTGATTAVAAVLVGLVAMYPLGAGAALGAGTAGSGAQLPWQQLVGLAHPGPAENVFSAVEAVLMQGVITAMAGGLLLVADGRRPRTWLRPLAAFGSIALTWYVVHLAVLASPLFTSPDGPLHRSAAAFLACTVLACGISLFWRRCSSRGPVEWLQHAAVRAVDRSSS